MAAPLVSVVIPCRNGAATIGWCLTAVYALRLARFEVIVVDDASQDDSVAIIERFPCRLIRLDRHGGAARARNVGARHSRGEVLFFTDADCLLAPDSLQRACRALAAAGPDAALGGTYTVQPHDPSFFSRVQSVFVHYSETKQAREPDYLATHALAIRADTFRRTGGFAEDIRPILEDVEYSHRLRRAGYRLVIDPSVQVEHVFNFSLVRSLRNAYVKAMHWTRYSLANHDLLADSGTASHELKLNVVALFASGLLLLSYVATHAEAWLGPLLLAQGGNVWFNRRLLRAFYRARGAGFAAGAAAYYLLLYPLAVGAGAGAGLARALAHRPARRPG